MTGYYYVHLLSVWQFIFPILESQFFYKSPNLFAITENTKDKLKEINGTIIQTIKKTSENSFCWQANLFVYNLHKTKADLPSLPPIKIFLLAVKVVLKL